MTVPANLNYTDIQTRVMNAMRIPTTNTVEAAKVAGEYEMRDTSEADMTQAG